LFALLQYLRQRIICNSSSSAMLARNGVCSNNEKMQLKSGPHQHTTSINAAPEQAHHPPPKSRLARAPAEENTITHNAAE
jgi:hypothetical protein